jgi:hypothetical protein
MYFSHIHSIITHGIIFGGNSAGSDKVFKLQKEPLELLQILIALPHVVTYLTQSQYILSLAVYVAKIIDDFTTDLDNHSINTLHISISSLYPPLLRPTKYQKGVYYTGIKILVYNCLSLTIKELSGNIKHLKNLLKKKFLLQGSFYTVEELLDWICINNFIHFVCMIVNTVISHMLA